MRSQVRFEAPSPVGDTKPHTLELKALYPHVYGPITKDSVVATYNMLRSEDGTFVGITGLTQA